MRSRAFGATSTKVSEVGLGTAQFSKASRSQNETGCMTLDRAKSIIFAAIDNGITFFDTADCYGPAEYLLGQLSSETKEELHIATKAGLRPNLERDFSIDYLTSRVEDSRRLLQVDSLDIFQLNKPSLKDLKDERLFDFLSDLKESGRSRYCGVVVGDPAVGDICLQSESIDCVQVMYHLLYLGHEELIANASERGLGVIVRSPLNSGFLSGIYTHETVFPSGDDRSDFFSGDHFTKRLAVLDDILNEIPVNREDLLEYALQFVLSNNSVSVTIPGASSDSQLLRYLNATRGEFLSNQEILHVQQVLSQRLDQLQQPLQN